LLSRKAFAPSAIACGFEAAPRRYCERKRNNPEIDERFWIASALRASQ
jgi:hypothetical protein